MKTVHKIIIGDSRQMGEVLDESVHLIIEKDEGKEGEKGKGEGKNF